MDTLEDLQEEFDSAMDAYQNSIGTKYEASCAGAMNRALSALEDYEYTE
jgi:hypothetical protein